MESFDEEFLISDLESKIENNFWEFYQNYLMELYRELDSGPVDRFLPPLKPRDEALIHHHQQRLLQQIDQFDIQDGEEENPLLEPSITHSITEVTQSLISMHSKYYESVLIMLQYYSTVNTLQLRQQYAIIIMFLLSGFEIPDLNE